MNNSRYEFIRAQLLRTLPAEDRKIFFMHEKLESMLADKAATEEEFFSLLVSNSPVIQTAAAFSLPADFVFEKVQFIEQKLHELTEETLKQALIFETSSNLSYEENMKGSKRHFQLNVPAFSFKK
ncbi:hypothetical protein [Alkalicoccus daliensis]|uniref:Uncharacterized protein n=1 Tax=Alkalicoccus daliensis TaxID=745820 RepID=A0A1G9ZB93_9BACI|nr:hypothetical protein [Alkalicoccus daliensis]SDN17896.1 hypothetical protein SAMN04488053_1018 [Alkalicoccus daliensis]